MKNLLFQGIYDKKTFLHLKNLGIQDFSFDLRPESPNLMTFSEAKNILSLATTEHFFLVFSKENSNTIRSYKNLLNYNPQKLTTIIRDHFQLSELNQLDDFYWMFHPVSDWRDILRLPQLKGVFLPLNFQDFYNLEPDVWRMIDARGLDVYLHASSVEQSLALEFDQNLKLSMDLSFEVESGYRMVDYKKLNQLKIWSVFS